MKHLFKFDLEHDWKMAAATITVTLLIMIDRYNNFTDSVYLDRFILFLPSNPPTRNRNPPDSHETAR